MADGESMTASNPEKPLLTGLLTRHEVAAQPGISVRTPDRWHRRHTGTPRFSIGRMRLHGTKAVRRWIEQNEVSGLERSSRRPRLAGGADR